MSKRIKIILDTDIGDDIDDALALGLICGCPELELLGVTTVFGNVGARARQARSVLKVAGEKFERIPVALGCGSAMSSRPTRGAADYLNGTLPNQDSSCLPESELPPPDKRHAVNFLIDTIMAGDGDIIPIPIGPLTNLAAAIVLEGRIVAKIPRIMVMAAEFKRPFPEYNIDNDPEAAHIVFSSGIPMEVITWDIGHTVKFDQAHVDLLAQSDRPLAKRLAVAIHAWQNAHQHNGNKPTPSLYDPMAIATLLQPDLCTWRTGTVSVELVGTKTYGFSRFEDNADGPHRIAWDADRQRSLDFCLSRILGV